MRNTKVLHRFTTVSAQSTSLSLVILTHTISIFFASLSSYELGRIFATNNFLCTPS